MIPVPGNTRVWLAAGVTDMRRDGNTFLFDEAHTAHAHQFVLDLDTEAITDLIRGIRNLW